MKVGDWVCRCGTVNASASSRCSRCGKNPGYSLDIGQMSAATKVLLVGGCLGLGYLVFFVLAMAKG